MGSIKVQHGLQFKIIWLKMASWKTAIHLLCILVGVITFINETEAGRVKQSKLQYDPPRLKDFIRIKNHYYKKPGDKKFVLNKTKNSTDFKLNVNI